uniref:Uncharacterized protein n=1 Tax=Micromonas pusilla TaxID=38833 RepID=A0A6U0JLU7_MICPS
MLVNSSLYCFHIDFEAISITPRNIDNSATIYCAVECIHSKCWRGIDDDVVWINYDAHQKIDQLVSTTPYYQIFERNTSFFCQGLSQLTRFGIRIDVRKFKRRQRFSHLWGGAIWVLIGI